jgi:WD40 repeat protein
MPSGCSTGPASSTASWRAPAWTGHLLATLTDPGTKGVNSVAFSSDGKTLATGDGDGNSIDLWDVGGGH